MEYDAREHPARQRQRRLSRRVMNRAEMTGAVEKSTRAVAVSRGVTLRRERTAGKPKRVNAFALAMIEWDCPSRAAARAGMAATVRRMKAETRRHGVFNHRNADYRSVAVPATGVREAEQIRARPAARELRLTWGRYVGTGHFRTTHAPRT
jgi:hypothetical protein